MATQLGGTVAELNARMSNAEFVAWMIYYGRRGQEAQLARAEAQQGR